MTGAWKQEKGILLMFDSEESRDTALTWFKNGKQKEFHRLNFVKADQKKNLIEEIKLTTTCLFKEPLFSS